MLKGFAGLRVLALESRHAQEMANLIAAYGGRPVLAPAMREVPLESNPEALAFATALLNGEYDMVVFLTGVGARTLIRAVETLYSREQFVAALQRVMVVARGPKPLGVLRELGVRPSLDVPEPNTWREILHALDEAARSQVFPRLEGLRIALQEYGASNLELLAGLQQRGARVTRVPVYQWALPEDVAPLRAAVTSLAGGDLDVVLFTTGVQAAHLFQVAAEMSLEEALRRGLSRTVIASIGPVTSQELRRRGVSADLEPSHPKMGFLVKEASERCAELLQQKRGSSTAP